MTNDIVDINEQGVSFLRTEYHGAIWIEHRAQPHTTLWETRYSEAYTLVDDDHHPLYDERGEEYRFETVAQAERKIRELLTPKLSALAQAYAESREEVAPA